MVTHYNNVTTHYNTLQQCSAGKQGHNSIPQQYLATCRCITEEVNNYISHPSFQFVAHPNCQQHLTNIWHGPEMGFLQTLEVPKKLMMWVICVPLVPIFCLVYVFYPESKVGLVLVYQHGML